MRTYTNVTSSFYLSFRTFSSLTYRFTVAVYCLQLFTFIDIGWVLMFGMSDLNNVACWSYLTDIAKLIGRGFLIDLTVAHFGCKRFGYRLCSGTAWHFSPWFPVSLPPRKIMRLFQRLGKRQTRFVSDEPPRKKIKSCHPPKAADTWTDKQLPFPSVDKKLQIQIHFEYEWRPVNRSVSGFRWRTRICILFLSTSGSTCGVFMSQRQESQALVLLSQPCWVWLMLPMY